MDFIKLKSYNNKVVLFNNDTEGELDNTDSDGKYNFMFSINDMELDLINYLRIKSIRGEKTAIVLKKVRSVELIDENRIKFSSSENFISYYNSVGDYRLVHSNGNYVIFYYLKEDASKVLKAWKHLFKLIGINLTGDLF